MSGNLYTTYFSNLRNIPNGMQVYSVVRQPQDIPNIECFSPSAVLLNQYKSKKITYLEFRRKFIDELQDNKVASNTFNSILRIINSGKDVVFVCYEKKADYCHRQILGEIFSKAGISYKGEL